MNDVAIVDMKDKKLADNVLKMGQAILESNEDRAALAKIHATICSRLDSIPHPTKQPISLKQSPPARP